MHEIDSLGRVAAALTGVALAITAAWIVRGERRREVRVDDLPLDLDGSLRREATE